jgi:hypothetical protein
VISRCFRGGLFYEARYHSEPVCVFVGKDEAGKAKFACMRSIAGSLRKDVYGSDKEVWQDILDGLELYVQEMKDCGDMGRWIKECEDLSEQLQGSGRPESRLIASLLEWTAVPFGA